MLKNIKRFHSLLFLLSAVGVVLAVNISKGYVLAPDSYTFSIWADSLIKAQWNVASFLESVRAIHPVQHYLIPVTILALAKNFAGEGWVQLFFGFNILLTIMIAGLFYYISLALKICNLGTIIGCFSVFIISTDFLIWPRYLLTDILFAFLVATLIACFIATLFENSKVGKILSLIVCLLIILSRPTWIPYVTVTILFLLMPLKFIKPLPVVTILATGVLSVAIAGASFVFLYSNIAEFNSFAAVDWLDQWVQGGVVVHDRPNTYVDNMTRNYVDLTYLYLKRVIYFFSFYSTDWSFGHKAFNTIWMTSFWCCLILCFNRWDRLESAIKVLICYLTALILGAALFQSFILIDYDWRYRFPLIVPMGIIISIGASNLLVLIANRSQNLKNYY